MRSISTVLGAGLLLIATTLAAQAEKRVALVIGNGAYENATQLPNPRNDAEDVAAALKRAGFDTIVGVDLDRSGMDEATIEFARAARESDVALFYYSGHAMQFAGVNYLMPVDAKLSDEADLRRMARVDEILADLQQAKNLRILVLDACRDNPLAEELKRSIARTRAANLSRGLAKIDAPEGMIVAFSTQAERTAADGSGRNSPYTTAFLRHIDTPSEIGRVFRRISADVYEATNHSQLPELSLSMIGEYYLRGEPETAADSAAPPPPASPTPAPDPAADAWQAVKDSDSEGVLETFIGKFSPSFYAELAAARLSEVKRKREQAEAAAREEARRREEEAERRRAEEDARRHREEEAARLAAEEREQQLAARTPADSGIAIPPAGGGDWFVILGSWPKSQRSKATQRISYLRGRGVQAHIIDTNKYRNLSNGLYAVVVGPYDKLSAERTLSSIIGVVGDAYIKSGR